MYVYFATYIHHVHEIENIKIISCHSAHVPYHVTRETNCWSGIVNNHIKSATECLEQVRVSHVTSLNLRSAVMEQGSKDRNNSYFIWVLHDCWKHAGMEGHLFSQPKTSAVTLTGRAVNKDKVQNPIAKTWDLDFIKPNPRPRTSAL